MSVICHIIIMEWGRFLWTCLMCCFVFFCTAEGARYTSFIIPDDMKQKIKIVWFWFSITFPFTSLLRASVLITKCTWIKNMWPHLRSASYKQQQRQCWGHHIRLYLDSMFTDLFLLCLRVNVCVNNYSLCLLVWFLYAWVWVWVYLSSAVFNPWRIPLLFCPLSTL